MRTITESESTPAADGFHMPAEFAPQERVWMGWPHRTDTWAFGAKPAQAQYAGAARAIARFTPVTMCANQEDYAACRHVFEADEGVRVIEMSTNDAWFRDTGCTFVIDGAGGKRAVHWNFNAYGGLVDGDYFPWDEDAQIGLKMAELAEVRRYRPDDLVLEGGSITVDGEGTVIVTESCLLSPGRTASAVRAKAPANDSRATRELLFKPFSEELRAYVEERLRAYLGVEKVLWVREGIDPGETNGHIDDVATFVAPGQVACIWTDDPKHPFYRQSHEAYDELCAATDARGRRLSVHKLPLTARAHYMDAASCASLDASENAPARSPEDPLITSYMNYLVTNGGLIVPQYGDENDELALKTLQEIYDEAWGAGAYTAVGVPSEQVVFGGGNIHCITQQEPRA